MKKREKLAPHEADKLKEMNLSPKAEGIIEEIWKMSSTAPVGPSKNVKKFLELYLNPFLILFLFIGRLRYITLFLLRTACFLFMISLPALIMAARTSNRDILFSWMLMGMWHDAKNMKKQEKIFTKAYVGILASILAYLGYIFTSLAIPIITLASKFLNRKIVERVQGELDQIDAA